MKITLLNNTQVEAMDQETGETAQTSVDIEVLQKGQSGKHRHMHSTFTPEHSRAILYSQNTIKDIKAPF